MSNFKRSGSRDRTIGWLHGSAQKRTRYPNSLGRTTTLLRPVQRVECFRTGIQKNFDRLTCVVQRVVYGNETILRGRVALCGSGLSGGVKRKNLEVSAPPKPLDSIFCVRVNAKLYFMQSHESQQQSAQVQGPPSQHAHPASHVPQSQVVAVDITT